jgi:hypothetical protein
MKCLVQWAVLFEQWKSAMDGIEMDVPEPTDDLLSKIAAGEPIPGLALPRRRR